LPKTDGILTVDYPNRAFYTLFGVFITVKGGYDSAGQIMRESRTLFSYLYIIRDTYISKSVITISMSIIKL